MKLTKKKAKTLESAIHTWTEEKVISPEERRKLLDSYEVISFDWKRLAKYSFWVALICIVMAITSLIADEAFMELLAQIFNAPALVKCLAFVFAATALYWRGCKRRTTKPEKIYSNEAIFFLGVLATAASIAFFGEALDTGSGHFSILILLASIVYATLGLWFPSKLVWIFALLSLGSWLGTETGYMSGWGAYYLGMNYPLRFVFFGLLLTLASVAFNHWNIRKEFSRPTRAIGLLYLFISLWIMSIFGNYGDIQKWYDVKQIELFHWSLLFALAALASIFHSLKHDDGMTKGFGLTFLFINLYTRFFEHFWDTLHEALFFSLLAISFWYVGSRAEKIWNLGGLRYPAKLNEIPER